MAGTTTRYDFSPYQTSDDKMTLSFDIVPADHPHNTGTVNKIYFEVISGMHAELLIVVA